MGNVHVEVAMLLSRFEREETHAIAMFRIIHYESTSGHEQRFNLCAHATRPAHECPPVLSYNRIL